MNARALTFPPGVRGNIFRNGAGNYVLTAVEPQADTLTPTACAAPLMVEGIARAYLWTKDDRFRRVLTEALPRGARGGSYGKGSSMYYRMAPRVLADLSAAGLTLNDSPANDR